MQWWEQWRELPKHRAFRHTLETLHEVEDGKHEWKPPEADDPHAYDAHLLRSTQGPVRIIRYRIEGNDFGELHKFDSVLDHIRNGTPKAKRRVFIVHGETGSGRGTLFHYLADNFAEAKAGCAYDWGLFTNANFSTEYSSVVDGVIHFLMRCTISEVEQYTAIDFPKLPRRGAVSNYLKTIFKTDRVGRGMFVIGGAELLFRGADGVPKNTEIADALSAFLDEESAAYPLDVVLISRTDKCRAIFADDLDPALETQEINATLGQMVEVNIDDLKSTPALKRRKPEFKARVVKLNLPSLKDTIHAAIKSANDGLQANGSTQEIDPKAVHGAIHGALADAIKGRFASSIVTQCALESVKRNGPSAFLTFLKTLGDALTRVEAGKTADIILATVLDQYTNLYSEDKTIGPQLFHLILKHVAIMAGPIEVAVLACCPEIRKCGMDGANEAKLSRKAKRAREAKLNAKLVRHLEWLVSKQLLFELRTRDEFRADGAARNEGQFKRYAAHKILQGYFFHRLGAPFLELGDARLFTVSLFASQGTNLPAPSHSAFKFLRDLILSLIEYPHDEAKTRDKRPEAERRRDVCALRAAVSLTRSAFSFAVVSRFSDFDEAPWLGESRFGFFEQYRLLLRWMIYRAGMLADDRKTAEFESELRGVWNRIKPDRPEDLDREHVEKIHLKYRFNALYQDEITWLYNECGLVALAQGNLIQAQRLLAQAIESNRLIEIGSDAGPNAMRIRLNQAVVQIEQADLEGASTALRSIHQASLCEPVVNAVTRGYRGLVAHLRGRSNQAHELYDGAIQMLRNLGEARALSIFRKHRADLKRKTGDTQGCRLDLLSALAEAEAARQNDQIHRVQISLALCDMAESRPPADHIRRVFRRLDEAIRYADRMEIPFLKAEALLARTQVIHRQGETRAAGEEAVKAMAIANLYGQRLRAITALGRLGEVIADRPGHEAQGERILVAAGKMADACEYQLAKWKIGEGLISHSGDGAPTQKARV